MDRHDAGAAPIVGRDAELSALLAALERAAGGRPGAVLLTGDAGVGKTRLLRAAAERARATGARVLVGHCLDLGDVGVPFLPVAEVLSTLVAAASDGDDGVRAALAARPVLARLSPAVGALLGSDAAAADPATADRLALFEAVEGLLLELASGGGPVVLVLEDLHWADASTRDLLRFLLARLRDGRLLVLASVRAEDLHRRHPLRPLLAELGRLGAVRRVELGPLRPEALVEHLRHLDAAGDGPGRSDAQLAQVADRSEGNPYYAEELLVSGAAADGGLPGAVADVLLGRTTALDAPARRAVAAAAVGGAAVSDRLLRAVLGEELPGGAAAVDAALEAAVGAAVLVPRADGYGFRHALLQEAVLDDLLPGERTALHGGYARLLAQAAAAGAPLAPAAELARHATASHDAPTALAASTAAAAEALDRLAPAEALRHVEHALALLPVVPSADEAALAAPLAAAVGSLPLLTAVAAELAARAGEPGRALEHVRRAVALAEGPVQGVRARTSAVLHLLAADVDGSLTAQAGGLLGEAEELLGQLAGVPEPEVEALRAQVLVRRGRVALVRDDLAAAGRAATSALPLARAAGDAAAEAEARATLAVVHDVAGGDAEVTEHLARALELAAAAGDPLAASRASYLLGMHHWGAGRVPEALARYERVSAELAAHGLAWSRYGVAAVWMTSVARYAAGDLAGAAAAAAHGASGPDPVHRTLTQAVGLLAEVALGDDGAAERAAALLPAVASDPLATMQALGARAEALAWQGRGLEAARAAQDGLAVAESVDLEEALSGVWLSALAVAALADARGGASDGADVAHRGRLLSLRSPGRGGPLGPEGRAWLARLDAELARLAEPGATEAAAAVAAWRTALEAFGYGHRYEQARCRWRLAEALLATGDGDARDEARALLATALDEARRMAAAPLAGAVRDLARRARLRLDGGTGAGPGGRDVVVDSPLTDREGEVLALVAQGLTNRKVGERLFISEKTVSVHLSNAMAKLGASGRAEAVAVAARRGLLAPG